MNNKKKLKLIKKLCKNASPDDWGVPYVYASEILKIINNTEEKQCAICSIDGECGRATDQKWVKQWKQ